MSVSEKQTFEQIFDKHYDNNNKICTRRSLLEQFKTVAREWLHQKPIYHIECHDKVSLLTHGYFCANCGSYVLNSSLYFKTDELLEDLKK